MNDPRTTHDIRSAYRTVRRALLAERTAEGCWIGRLSPSALSTATAASALGLADRLMVYQQLLAVARSAAARGEAGQRKSVYEDAAKVFEARIIALARRRG